MATAKADIIAGPSNFDLMLSLFDREGYKARKVQFKIRRNGKEIVVSVAVYGVQIGHKSDGTSWSFYGGIYGNNEQDDPDLLATLPSFTGRVEGSYMTDSRKGKMWAVKCRDWQ